MKSLVLYFSIGGHTHTVAREIARQMDADIYEIKPVEAYSKDYQSLMLKGIGEVKMGHRPAIHDIDVNIDKYDTVFIGSPNWMDTFAPPVGTFLETHKIENKLVVPFVSYDQGGKGHMHEDIAQLCPRSRVIDSIVIKGDGGRELEKEVERAIAIKNIHNLEVKIMR